MIICYCGRNRDVVCCNHRRLESRRVASHETSSSSSSSAAAAAAAAATNVELLDYHCCVKMFFISVWRHRHYKITWRIVRWSCNRIKLTVLRPFLAERYYVTLHTLRSAIVIAICRLSSLSFVCRLCAVGRPILRRLNFSAIFLHHVVA